MRLFGRLATSHSAWSGWLLIFHKPNPKPYPASVGIKMLACCLLLEVVVRPLAREALRSVRAGTSHLNALALVSFMLLLAIALTVTWIRLPLARIGLDRWTNWGRAERSFFPMLLVLTVLVFAMAQWDQFAAFALRPVSVNAAIVVFCEQMIWGFYQEYVYRGLLQTELVRRFGAVRGILVSNLCFTFGPLHAYHFANTYSHPGRLLIFPGIFAIGLYFGILFHRSQNLWIIGAAHGLGDFFVDGVAKLKA